MLHQAQNFLRSGPFSGAITSGSSLPALKSRDTNSLKSALALDATNQAYSALVSLASAFAALKGDSSSWPSVALYYSTFYCARARLAQSGVAIFYIDKKPHRISSTVGSIPVRIKGNTHKVVIDQFRKEFSSDYFLSQTVGTSGQDAFAWLSALREQVNYRDARFIEPVSLATIPGSARTRPRQLFIGYLDPKQSYLIFDVDHAALAFPLNFLKDCIDREMSAGRWALEEEERRYLRTLFSDGAGPMTELLAAFHI